MLRIRKVADATTAVNRAAIEAAQKIMREQFPRCRTTTSPSCRSSSPTRSSTASSRGCSSPRMRATRRSVLALLLHAPDIGFSYLELISTALGRTGSGIGATLYERVREEARALGTQIYFESLPDDPALSPNPEIRANNASRLKFYERYGARPIVNTAYETPVQAGNHRPALSPARSARLKRSAEPRQGEEGGPRHPRAEIRARPPTMCRWWWTPSKTIRSACASRATSSRGER